VNSNIWVLTVADSVAIATTLILAALGVILNERAGVLNLGVEGMLLMAAVSAFLMSDFIASPWLALAVATGVGAVLGAVHALLCVSMRANQIVAGLALVIFGTGLSQFLGKTVEGVPRPVRLDALEIAGLADIPLLGPVLFSQGVLTYASWALAGVVALFLTHTRPGLGLRAVGESPATVDAQGLSVLAIRYAATIASGAFIGLAGGYYMLARATAWNQAATTAGIGWIALGLVVFAGWRPGRVVFGALLFGFALQVPFTLQAEQVRWLPPEIMATFPYVLTVTVLIAMSTPRARARFGAPVSLGLPFVRDER
jgi:general nucleoside transport system permease protein